MTYPSMPPKKLHKIASVNCCKLCNSPGPLHPCSHVIPQWMYEMQLQSRWSPKNPETGTTVIPAATVSLSSPSVAGNLKTEFQQCGVQSKNHQNKRRMRIVSSHPREHQKKSPTGIYGSFICKSCEDRFAAWDDYAADVLRSQPVVTSQGWNFGQYDYARVKKFFLSLLWRMHACEHDFFSNLNLDSCALTLANCLLNDDKDCLEKFEIIPTWSLHILSLGVMTPVKVQIEAVTYWQLYLPRFQVLVKVDPGPGASCLQPFAMADGANLCMLEKNFIEFRETDIVKQVFIENQKKMITVVKSPKNRIKSPCR